MQIEYEATFPNIDKDKIREKLKIIGAKLVKPEFLQKRYAFKPPVEDKKSYDWIRVRNEGDKITLSYKKIDGDKIYNQKEICLEVNNFKKAKDLLIAIGCKLKSYQETKRELWLFNKVEITIDEWPFLEPFVEIEGNSEEEVKKVSKRLGFDYKKALFCAIGTLYKMKYGISLDEINNKIPRITFESKNPFKK